MAMTMHIDIVSAEAEIYSGVATMVFAPAEMGEVGISARHAPLITRLKPGEVRVQSDKGDELSFYVSGGMLEIQPHVITVLADTAARAEDIDEKAALAAKDAAEKAMADEGDSITHEQAVSQLQEAVAQLKVLQQMKKLKHGGFK